MVALEKVMTISGAMLLAGVLLLAPEANAQQGGPAGEGQAKEMFGSAAKKAPVCQECEKQRRMHPERYPLVARRGDSDHPQNYHGNKYDDQNRSHKYYDKKNSEYGYGDRSRSHHKRKYGPPPWAPAHGRRAKHMYRYYPRSKVYYDKGRGLWFWMAGATWRSGHALPDSIRLDAGGMVRLGMDVGNPSSFHLDVIRYFPPPR